ncbi:hypothetical protein L198_02787 [Cryptococcus wingfieldii CBS 7118]|uniref:Tim44-like domain-containing protein n=1 Tax=Cryptococcus wingfieldii CBS 7118 TaxID=1295528 RepID=A0A1E3JN27_9TREE|nr:hypothetical protein L198_02787 [Cryptococcus wingfieldii CBS 7118]ODO02056.1 hypothetical protein L198_02787 [Cryptococcus wingfieldii CBS 7118]
MSLIPSFRQASSTATRGFSRSIRPSRVAYVPLSSSPLAFTRHASTAPKTKSKLTEDLEKKVEAQKAQMARAEKANPAMSFGTQTLPVFEPFLDPPTKLPEFLHRVWNKVNPWIKVDPEAEEFRRERYSYTVQTIGELMAKRALEEYRTSFLVHTPSPARHMWLWMRGPGAASKTVKAFAQKYYEYMQCQASGTIGQALALSKDEAYKTAQHIIRNRKDKLTWQLVKENKPPVLLSARMTMIDPRDMKIGAQIVVAFDTQQALITHKSNGTATRRTRRVEEMMIFERLIPHRDGWKIKGKLVPKENIVTQVPSSPAPSYHGIEK